MSESEHTPGPWTLTSWAERYPDKKKSRQDYWFIEGGRGFCPPDDQSSGFCISSHLSAGTARLIAAAPDMHAAITEYLALFDRCGGTEAVNASLFGAARDALRTALAKAEGRDTPAPGDR
jgi:hypothetical protein